MIPFNPYPCPTILYFLLFFFVFQVMYLFVLFSLFIHSFIRSNWNGYTVFIHKLFLNKKMDNEILSEQLMKKKYITVGKCRY